MPATRRVGLDLPAGQLDRMEAEVASCRYASASDFVSARLAEEDDARRIGFEARCTLPFSVRGDRVRIPRVLYAGRTAEGALP